MPRNKRWGVFLNVERDKKDLEYAAKKYHKTEGLIVGILIGQLKERGYLYETDTHAKENNVFKFLDGACKNMTYAKKNYICVRANLGKPPTIKALSDNEFESEKICKICEEDTRKKLDRNETLERVHELEAKLNVRSTEKFKVPVCNYGGTLAGDGVSFSACRLNPGKLTSIENYCKVRMNGKPCTSYVERLIGVGKKV